MDTLLGVELACPTRGTWPSKDTTNSTANAVERE
jgi:hypothetical protein